MQINRLYHNSNDTWACYSEPFSNSQNHSIERGIEYEAFSQARYSSVTALITEPILVSLRSIASLSCGGHWHHCGHCVSNPVNHQRDRNVHGRRIFVTAIEAVRHDSHLNWSVSEVLHAGAPGVTLESKKKLLRIHETLRTRDKEANRSRCR